MFDAAGILSHGTEDLDIGHGVEAVSFGQFFADELLDELFGVFWGWRGEYIKFAFGVSHLFAGWDNWKFSVVNAVRILNDEALFGLSKDCLQPDDRYGVRLDEVFEDGACTDAWKLVDVADENDARGIGHCNEERPHEHEIDHGSLVDNEYSRWEGIFFIAHEGAVLFALVSVFEESMNCFGVAGGCFAQSFGGSSGRRGEEDRDIEGLRSFDKHAYERCFTSSWAAGNDHKFFAQACQDGVALLFCQRDAEFCFNLFDACDVVGLWSGFAGCVDHAHNFLCDAIFKVIHERSENDGLAIFNLFGFDGAFFDEGVDFTGDLFGGDLEEFCGIFYEDGFGEIAVSVAIFGIIQRVINTGVDAHGVIGLDAHLDGDLVCFFKSDAVDFFCEEVGLLIEDWDNFISVALDEACGEVISKAMSLEVDKDLPGTLFFEPFFFNGFEFCGGYAFNFSELFGVVVENVDRIVAKLMNDAFRGA